ncbi:MAG: hypothetical protein GKS06_08890 [Acidobacteria bacterium]|nr:hypothetical protein [Acidobacteriota bacterium]
METTTFAILVALADGGHTAAVIHDALEESSGAATPVATFYRRLHALVDSGWIVAREDPSSGRGRPGKRFELTDDGIEAMRAEALRLQRLTRTALRSEATR